MKGGDKSMLSIIKNIFSPKGFIMKAGPVVFAAVVAIVQAISEQKEADRIDGME